MKNLTASSTEAGPRKPYSAAFIHSRLDDYGLTPAQFRVYFRVIRRGYCYESISRMAGGCRLNEDTVRTALSHLREHNLISVTKRPGQTTIHEANQDFSQWKPSNQEHWTSETNGCPPKPDGSHRNPRGDHPPEKRGYKGNPPEVDPLKEHPPLPKFSPLKHELFRKEYEAMLQDARQKLKEVRQKFRLKVLSQSIVETISWHKREAKPGWEKRVSELEADQLNYTSAKGLTDLGQLHESAWLNRIEEIEKVMRGQL